MLAHAQVRLIDSASNRPASGRSVLLLEPAGVFVGQVESDPGGIVIFPDDLTGQALLRFDGAPAIRVNVDDLRRTGVVEDISIPPRETRLVQLYGRVVDSSGQPVPAVGLALVRDADNAAFGSGVSDSNGAFVLTVSTPIPVGAAVSLRTSAASQPVQLPDLSKAAGLVGPITLVVDHKPATPSSGVAPKPVLLGTREEILDAVVRAPGLFGRAEPVHAPNVCSLAPGTNVIPRTFYLQQLALFPLVNPLGTGTVVTEVSDALDFVGVQPMLQSGGQILR